MDIIIFKRLESRSIRKLRKITIVLATPNQQTPKIMPISMQLL